MLLIFHTILLKEEFYRKEKFIKMKLLVNVSNVKEMDVSKESNFDEDI